MSRKTVLALLQLPSSAWVLQPASRRAEAAVVDMEAEAAVATGEAAASMVAGTASTVGEASTLELAVSAAITVTPTGTTMMTMVSAI